ncbi:MAG: hypothetical protein ACI9UA_004231, partial [Pseudoalteromonas tetraodonis]
GLWKGGRMLWGVEVKVGTVNRRSLPKGRTDASDAFRKRNVATV